MHRRRRAAVGKSGRRAACASLSLRVRGRLLCTGIKRREGLPLSLLPNRHLSTACAREDGEEREAASLSPPDSRERGEEETERSTSIMGRASSASGLALILPPIRASSRKSQLKPGRPPPADLAPPAGHLAPPAGVRPSVKLPAPFFPLLSLSSPNLLLAPPAPSVTVSFSPLVRVSSCRCPCDEAYGLLDWKRGRHERHPGSPVSAVARNLSVRRAPYLIAFRRAPATAPRRPVDDKYAASLFALRPWVPVQYLLQHI
ncbi:hypothetical protein AXF42_Ash008533 [Apostasia shenzhenica]|uniref:Uncharacterized protein n=1 Tax=Apostasia shenzhenica TaxID=1088818 RepID=A0A2I0B1N6_9ASPA|nr:hypothetical protein AXF42_Ash008533 [Apostasia shenzhenica]